MDIRYPNARQIDRYARDHQLTAAEITRDIARLVTIANLTERGFLHDYCVLSGGMALRLRGSNRFTRYDTDTAMKGQLDELELTGAMALNSANLRILPDEGHHWDRRSKLTIAQPIKYEAFFASIDPSAPVEDDFSFTVAQRGLKQPAQWLELVSPYAERSLSSPMRHFVSAFSERPPRSALAC